MSAGSFHWSRNPMGLYRDIRRGRVAGVCSGIGAYFEIEPKFVRIAAILGSVFGFFVPIAIAYVILALILKPMPDPMFANEAEAKFWRGMTASPNRTAEDIKARFSALDRRLATMEAHVTSDETSLRQKFRDL